MKAMTTTLFILLTFAFCTIGCDTPTDNQGGDSHVHSEDDGHDHSHDGHDHAAHDHSPKHGGHLIEIGRNHEYHAELVDDHAAKSVTVYMMDSHMEPLTVKQDSISLVLTAGDKTETFELSAAQGDGASKFSSSDAALVEMLKGEDVKGKLRVTIHGKPFSGAFDHHEH